MENNNKIKLCSEIVLMPVEDLVPYQQNAKKHPQRQIDVIKRSFKLTMFDQPIVINKRDRSIIKGHGRLEAAIQLGLLEVPVIILDVPVDVANKARLADNQSSLMSENDPDVLLKELMRYEKDIIDTGYKEDDLEKLLKSLSVDEDNRDNIDEDIDEDIEGEYEDESYYDEDIEEEFNGEFNGEFDKELEDIEDKKEKEYKEFLSKQKDDLEYEDDSEDYFDTDSKENKREGSTKEVNPDNFSFNHLCPKCGFQFN